MNFKKFAMLTLSCAVVYGFSMNANTASAATTDSITNETVAIQQDTVVSDENTQSQETEELKEDVQVTPQPTVTPQPDKKTTEKKTTKKTTKKKASYTKAELRLMASIINCEAGGESYQGKLAVGIVIMNRIKSKSFPNTLKKVIYQKYQFSPVRNGSLKKKLSQYDRGKTSSAQWKSCISAAKKTLSGQTTIKIGGKTKSMKGYKFFSVRLPGAKFKLGGHRFK